MALAALGLSACQVGGYDEVDLEPAAGEPVAGVVDVTDEALRWGPNDAPELLDPNVQRRFDALPLQGTTTAKPWPGFYWPTYLDSINYRWDGPHSVSATSKYNVAFHGGGGAGWSSPSAENELSTALGLIRHGSRATCTSDAHCTAPGETCGKRTGEAYGVCIPTWFGLCHAWAAASMMEPEPQRPVVHNGVTFKVNDLKALLTLFYDTASAKVISLRCDRDDNGGGIPYNPYGRPTDPELSCIDTNPGTFHVVLANQIGLKKQPIIHDRIFDAQVWNYPLRGYRVLESRDVSFQEANMLVGGVLAGNYIFNPQARRLIYVKLRTDYVGGTAANQDGPLTGYIEQFTGHDTYEYVLELDGQGRIEGGEWVGRSKRHHPDFLWLPVARQTSQVAGVHYNQVKWLLQQSIGTGTTPPDDGSSDGGDGSSDGGDGGSDPGTPVSVPGIMGDVERGGLRAFAIPVTANVPIVVETQSAKNVDVYVKFGTQPNFSDYDARAVSTHGNEKLNIRPTQTGTLYVQIFGVEAASFVLKVYYGQ